MSRTRAVLTHLLYWLLFLGVAIGYNTFADNNGVFSLAGLGRQLTSLYTYEEYSRVIVTFYVSLWVFTHYFYPRNLPVIFAQVVGLGFFDAILAYVLDHKIIGPLTDRWIIKPEADLVQFLSGDLTSSWLYVMLAFIFKHLQDHFKSEALLHEKNAIELAYLKSQLNPHFLFNSMNNLYGLALTEPARTPDAILKLAELLRYMLYESNEPHVALRQEVEYLTSYIALEKLRHEGEVHVDFAVEGAVGGRQIAPLLLISFVENAFKHGNVHNPARPIRLRLLVEPRRLAFTAENQVISKNKDQVGGVGLASVRRRLALLYPGRHRLDIAHEGDSFRCALVLEDDAVSPKPRAAVAAPASIPVPRPVGAAAPALRPL